jgi:tRNA threonylcarbamoyladenosine biosynthesis protein TsaE
MAFSLGDEALESALLKGILCSSVAETHRLSERFALTLPENTIVYLHGDLGSGKTSFVQGMARAYAIQMPITSPTFNLWHHHKGTLNLFHLDAYRLNSADEADRLYLEDFLEIPYVVCVEWPEKISNWELKPHCHLWFSQERDHPNARIIRLSR